MRKLLSAAIDEGADGDWGAFEGRYVSAVGTLHRSPTRSEVESVLEEMTLLRGEIVNLLGIKLNSENTDGNDVQNGRHTEFKSRIQL